jgi:zinc protease
MQNLVLREEDFKTEHMVVMEERRLRIDDDPQAYLEEQMEAAAFQISPYHWPVIGWMEDIKHFTLDDIRTYHQIYYNPVNAFIVVVGDFKKDELLSSISKAFGQIPKGHLPEQEKDRDPPQKGERRIYVKKEAHLPFLEIGYHVPNLTNSPDSYVLEVIACILSGGESSRLYKNLVYDKQLALSVDAENSLLSHDPDLFTISVEALPGKDTAEIEKALYQEIERLKKERVDEHELQKAKNLLEASFVYGQDSLSDQATLLAEYEIVSTWRSVDDYIPSIIKVTPDDIMRVAKTYFGQDNRTVSILVPLPPKREQTMPAGVLPERHIR